MRLIQREDNVLLYEIEQEGMFIRTTLYNIICPWGTFFTYNYQDALNKFDYWVEYLK